MKVLRSISYATLFVIYGLALANADLRLEVRHTGLGNLAHQLDSMSGLGPGSAGAYRELWSKQLTWSPEDETALNTWRDTWRKYQGRSRPMPIPRPAPLPIGVEGLDSFQRGRQLLQDSAAPDAFEVASKSLVSAPDQAMIMTVLDRFWPRFQDWYTKTAAPQLDTSKAGIQAAFTKHDLLPLYKKVAAFYSSELDTDTLVRVNLIMRPAWNRQSSGAQQIGSYSLVEVGQGEASDNRLDVVSHELFHYFYHEASAMRQLEMAEWFAEKSPEGGAAAYNLLNEVIATALGNGVVAKQINSTRFDRTLAMPMGFYADTYIDRTAKAVLPDVIAALASEGRLTDKTFLSKYLTAFQRANEGETQNPSLLLRSFFAATDEALMDSARGLMGVVRPGFGSIGTPADGQGMIRSLEGFRAVSIAIFVKSGKLEALDAWEKLLPKGELDKVRERAKGPGAFLAAIPRSPGSYAFIFVGASPVEIAPLLTKFGQLKEPPKTFIEAV